LRRIAKRRADQAHKFADWADFIEPEAASEPTAKASSRKSDPAEVKTVSSQLRDVLQAKWPYENVSGRIIKFAAEIGWSASRAKDVYYADPRVAIRAFEQAELDRWLATVDRCDA
jgi:hypothetical protein